jgi:hypothetical protein
MSNAWSRIIELFCQLLDLLIDASFLFFWGVVNWLLLRGLHYLHPSTVVVTVLWLVQGLYAAFTLAIIGLHIVRDLKGSHAPDAGLKAVAEKLSNMANQLYAITINSTYLGGWAGINAGLHLGLDLFRGESLNLIIISEWIGQFFVAIATLWKVVKWMNKDVMTIYHRLFP